MLNRHRADIDIKTLRFITTKQKEYAYFNEKEYLVKVKKDD